VAIAARSDELFDAQHRNDIDERAFASIQVRRGVEPDGCCRPRPPLRRSNPPVLLDWRKKLPRARDFLQSCHGIDARKSMIWRRLRPGMRAALHSGTGREPK